jgi:predicted nucleic acid-binding protein
MLLVVDSSIILKWFFHSRGNESDADGALAILSGIDAGRIQLAQPPHFIAEVAAVLAREKPDDASADLRDLLDVESS